jgi:hypothetical protein
MQIKNILNNINSGRISIIIPAVIIVLGILIRLKLLLLNVPYGQDACALSSSLNRNFLELFQPLDYFQVAPPVFMILSSFLVKILGNNYAFETKDLILRLLPFICGVISMPLFYMLIKKITDNKYFIYVCLFIFSFNFPAIMYSAQFKQYTLELMISLILLNMFFTINVKEILIRKLLWLSLFIAIAPWCSHTSFIIIFAGFITILIDILNNKYFDLKKCLILLLPILISSVIFCKFYYMPIRMSSTYDFMQDFWNNVEPSFFTLGNFINMFGEKNENFLKFNMNGYVYLIFLIINAIILFFRKNIKEICLILIPILICIIASFFKIFPYEGRMIIYTLPLFLILSCQFLLIIKNQKAAYISAVIVLIYLIFTNYIKPTDEYYKLSDYFDERNILKVLKEKNPEYHNVISTDILSGHYIGCEILFSDNKMHYDFKDSLTYSFLEQAKPDEYWIVGVMDWEPYKTGFLKYIEDNKNKIQVIDLYFDNNNNNFLAQIKK